jgi:hypothetical protein
LRQSVIATLLAPAPRWTTERPGKRRLDGESRGTP